MSNKVKDIDTKTRTNYFFNDFINLKKIDRNNTKIHKKSYRDILIYYIGHATVIDFKYAKIIVVFFLFLIFGKMNRYFEEINKNKRENKK